MKGLVFVQFLEMVEEKFSPDLAQDIVDAANLPSGGAYTTLGTYDHQEIVQLVSALNAATGLAVPDLIRTFGEHLFGKLAIVYPQFFEGINHAFDFLQCIDGYIHMEVRKLYPEAELPTFVYQRLSEHELRMEYRSTRPFADLAEGMVLACIRHFGGGIEMERQNMLGIPGTAATFVLRQF